MPFEKMLIRDEASPGGSGHFKLKRFVSESHVLSPASSFTATCRSLRTQDISERRLIGARDSVMSQQMSILSPVISVKVDGLGRTW